MFHYWLSLLSCYTYANLEILQAFQFNRFMFVCLFYTVNVYSFHCSMSSFFVVRVSLKLLNFNLFCIGSLSIVFLSFVRELSLLLHESIDKNCISLNNDIEFESALNWVKYIIDQNYLVLSYVWIKKKIGKINNFSVCCFEKKYFYLFFLYLFD